MQKAVIFGALTALFFLFTPAMPAQDVDEVVNLRRENELLKKEIERLKKEVELLKKEAKVQQEGVGGLKTGTKDLELLQGTWNIDSMEWGDHSVPKELMKGYKFVFAGNKLTWEAAISIMSRGGKISAIDGAYPCDFKIDPSKKPMEIDITMHLKQGDRTLLGIYEINGGVLKVCYYANQTGRRPADFSNKDDRKIGCITMTRAKK